jgi:GTP pyrophosphokinase
MMVAQPPRNRFEELTLSLRQLTRAGGLPSAERRRIACEALEIHAPDAARLGWHELRCELEDRAFELLAPQEYRRIVALLDRTRQGRAANLESMAVEIRKRLEEAGIHAVIHGRAKHLYGIWRKMHRKDLGFRHIHDVRALRIIVHSTTACYRTLRLIHGLWRPLPEEFDDYIVSPKPSGYRSLHTAVVRDDGRTAEVQIRTREMHRACRRGVVAHWRYKARLRQEHPLFTGEAQLSA